MDAPQKKHQKTIAIKFNLLKQDEKDLFYAIKKEAKNHLRSAPSLIKITMLQKVGLQEAPEKTQYVDSDEST